MDWAWLPPRRWLLAEKPFRDILMGIMAEGHRKLDSSHPHHTATGRAVGGVRTGDPGRAQTAPVATGEPGRAVCARAAGLVTEGSETGAANTFQTGLAVGDGGATVEAGRSEALPGDAGQPHPTFALLAGREAQPAEADTGLAGQAASAVGIGAAAFEPRGAETGVAQARQPGSALSVTGAGLEPERPPARTIVAVQSVRTGAVGLAGAEAHPADADPLAARGRRGAGEVRPAVRTLPAAVQNTTRLGVSGRGLSGL